MRNRARRNLNIRASQRRSNPSVSEAGGNACAHVNRNLGANTNAEPYTSRDRQACASPSPYADTCGDGCRANGGVDTSTHVYAGHANVDTSTHVYAGHANVDTSTHVYAGHANVDSYAYGYDHAGSQAYAQTGPRANADQCSNGGAPAGAYIR